ncbi:hypothetical protein Pmani_017715 [Petrolisthes manimaculis]|uniref:Monocarboxylate transporter 10 n=1 Tax=Petrolisthes manimaculis TaxID=1843537 RepID=A0AAE1U559_9EUCA|nr:hypothetical protein Pmani_017715 [Petrolisthes manimaculis]
MATRDDNEKGLIEEEGAEAMLMSSRDRDGDVSARAESPHFQATDIAMSIENGHVMHGMDAGLVDKVAMENYDVPLHVLNFTPPDGGCRAYIVMMASFLCNGIIFGIINTSGLIYEKISIKLENDGDENASFKASMVMSLAIGSTFLLSVLAGVLTDRLGIRITTFAGGALATSGMFISSFFYNQVEVLMVTYGLMFGIGSSLAYTPSLVVLGHYFQRRMGLINGFVTAGSSIFTIAMPFILPHLLDHGLQITFQVLTGFCAFLMVAALVFKPLMPHLPPPQRELEEARSGCAGRCRGFWRGIINFEIWRNKRYVIWALAIPSALFGYFVPYVHLVKYVRDVLGQDANSQMLVVCIGATSGLGRIIFGLIADRPWVNRILLQQVSFFCIGGLTMLLTAANHMVFFVIISLGMGFFDGCFISLLGPIAFDLVGHSGASQAIGCLLAMCSIPLTCGPAIAGALYDHMHSYLIPFLCAGLPPIIGAFVLFSIRLVKTPPKGVPGSPVREVGGEKQNNATATTTDDPRDAHKHVPEETQSEV